MYAERYASCTSISRIEGHELKILVEVQEKMVEHALRFEIEGS